MPKTTCQCTLFLSSKFVRYVASLLFWLLPLGFVSHSRVDNRNGLRDTPSFVVNMMSQYANILIYFEMPSWLKDWDNIVEEEDDPDDVKALKVRLLEIVL